MIQWASMANDGARQFFRISCPCGAALRLDVLTANRRQRCPSCNLSLSFVVTMDGRSKSPRVSIVVAPEAMNLEGESLAVMSRSEEPAAPEPEPAPPPRQRGKTVKGVLGTCSCGTSFPVDDEELTSIQACPNCGVEYHVVVKIERGTRTRTAILVPVKTTNVRRPSISPRVLVPPPPTRSVKRTQLPAKGRTRVAVPKAPPVIPPGAQRVDCSCGEPLAVRKKDVLRGMACPSCGRALKFQEVPNPQTLSPVIRIRPESKD